MYENRNVQVRYSLIQGHLCFSVLHPRAHSQGFFLCPWDWHFQVCVWLVRAQCWAGPNSYLRDGAFTVDDNAWAAKHSKTHRPRLCGFYPWCHQSPWRVQRHGAQVPRIPLWVMQTFSDFFVTVIIILTSILSGIFAKFMIHPHIYCTYMYIPELQNRWTFTYMTAVQFG